MSSNMGKKYEISMKNFIFGVRCIKRRTKIFQKMLLSLKSFIEQIP